MFLQDSSPKLRYQGLPVYPNILVSSSACPPIPPQLLMGTAESLWGKTLLLRLQGMVLSYQPEGPKPRKILDLNSTMFLWLNPTTMAIWNGLVLACLRQATSPILVCIPGEGNYKGLKPKQKNWSGAVAGDGGCPETGRRGRRSYSWTRR